MQRLVQGKRRHPHPCYLRKKCLCHLLHDSNNLSPEEIANIKTQLKLLNKRNHDLVELTKACWYKGVCAKIHEINMDPWLAWENNHILSGGKTAHHMTNLNMSMRLENGELASNARENMSVFGVHFHKVLNNHQPVNHTVLDLLEQKPCMTSIDNPISFTEVKRAINKLKKGKHQASTAFPLKHSKQWTTSCNVPCIAMSVTSLKKR